MVVVGRSYDQCWLRELLVSRLQLLDRSQLFDRSRCKVAMRYLRWREQYCSCNRAVHAPELSRPVTNPQEWRTFLQ
jgi:hypothetical protein